MAMTLKRKLYPRGGSFETTIPMQLLFSIDMTKKNNVLFKYDTAANRWYVEFEGEEEVSGSGSEENDIKYAARTVSRKSR